MLVVAKITATNVQGTSVESSLNAIGAFIETVPHAPISAPTRGINTNEN